MINRTETDRQVGGSRTSADVIPLSGEDKRTLLYMARRTLATYLELGELPDFHVDSPSLLQERGAFVTLWRRDNGDLRGCRGECVPRHCLFQAVSLMAVAAAVDDPRFYPVAADQVPLLRIAINALTPLAPIRPEEIEVGRHGLMVLNGEHAGLLLPEVPVRFGWDREMFLAGVCEKASLPLLAWQDSQTEIYGFETEEWSEEE